MRALIVLCVVAVTCADKLGYNYRPVEHSNFGLSFVPGGSPVLPVHLSGGSTSQHSIGGSSLLGGAGVGVGGLVSGFGNSGSSGTFGLSGSSGGFGVSGFHSGIHNGGSSGVFASSQGGFNGGVANAPHVEIEKEFYTFTANEDDFAVPHIENQIVNSAKKGIRVIFIKGPENNGLENAAVAFAKHIAEQKTAIYVLTKQPDVSNLGKKLNIINNNINHKPEVHFVKYRTHEDAVNAQKAIQSQYDSLGGISSNFNGGTAPVLNFVSKAPIASHGSHGSIGSTGSSGSSGSLGSSGSFQSSGSLGSVGSSGLSPPSNSHISLSAPATTYLPA